MVEHIVIPVIICLALFVCAFAWWQIVWEKLGLGLLLAIFLVALTVASYAMTFASIFAICSTFAGCVFGLLWAIRNSDKAY